MRESPKILRVAWTTGVVLLLLWGAAAFGAVYRWAYFPLLIGSAILGLTGLLIGRGSLPLLLGSAIGVVALAVGLQIVALPVAVVEVISPASVAGHRQLSVLASLQPERPLSVSIDPARTLLALAFLISFALLVLGAARMLTRELARAVALLITMLGLAMALTAMVQRAFFTGEIYGFWPLQQGGDPFGPFVNKNHYAGWMVMCLPVAIGLSLSVFYRSRAPRRGRELVIWLGSAEGSKVLLLFFGAALMAISLVLSMSRSGMIAFAAAALIIIAIIGVQRRSLRHSIVWSGLFVGTALVVLLVAGFATVAARFEASDTLSLGGRIAIWEQSAAIAERFWLTGSGLNTYGVTTLLYGEPLFGRHLQQAHNDYLQLAVEGGLLLGVPIVFVIGALVTLIRRRIREEGTTISLVRAGAITGLLAVAIQSLVEFSLQIPGNAVLFCILCAVAIHDGRRV